MRSTSRVTAIVLAAALIALPAVASAEHSAARKLGRGLAAMTCGFLEVPGSIVSTSRDKGYAYGFTLGFAEGLGRLVVRELVGVYEFLSAPIEAPAGFEPILDPEFPWDYFDDSTGDSGGVP